MAVVIVSPAAIADLAEIKDYLAASGGPAVADAYEHDFDATFERLSRHPGIGAPRRNLGRNVRIIPLAPYTIYYDGTPKAKRVIVLRVVRGRRRVTKKLLAEGREG